MEIEGAEPDVGKYGLTVICSKKKTTAIAVWFSLL